jgi:hypothetical protein
MPADPGPDPVASTALAAMPSTQQAAVMSLFSRYLNLAAAVQAAGPVTVRPVNEDLLAAPSSRVGSADALLEQAQALWEQAADLGELARITSELAVALSEHVHEAIELPRELCPCCKQFRNYLDKDDDND